MQDTVRVEPFDVAQDRLGAAESKHERLIYQPPARFDSAALAAEFILSNVEGLSTNGFCIKLLDHREYGMKEKKPRWKTIGANL